MLYLSVFQRKEIDNGVIENGDIIQPLDKTDKSAGAAKGHQQQDENDAIINLIQGKNEDQHVKKDNTDSDVF